MVPNGKIIAGNIINFSREPVRRNELIISVAYDSDIDQVKSLIANIIASDDRILKDKEQTVRLNELGHPPSTLSCASGAKAAICKTFTGMFWNVSNVILMPTGSASRIHRWT